MRERRSDEILVPKGSLLVACLTVLYLSHSCEAYLTPKTPVAESFPFERTMLNHELLTKKEEHQLARKVKRAQEVQAKVDGLLSEHQTILHRATTRADLLVGNANALSFGAWDDEEHYYSHFSSIDTVTEKSALLQQHDERSRLSQARMLELSENGNNNILETTALGDLEVDDEEEIMKQLGLSSRKELDDILTEGAMARDKLIRHNLKLVASISKRWSHMAASSSVYSNTNRPALSEVVQEGVLGLSAAVDRFDPAKGLRLSTYATYYITNSVRRSFQLTSTGTIRVPYNYYDTKTRFKTLCRMYFEKDGCLPAFGVLASDLNLAEKRLRLILRMTKPHLSTDERLYRHRQSDKEQTLLSVQVDKQGLSPEEMVELSLLRQSLENAMATELAPHERDVLRLRLGLDDGVAKTCRQVAQECGGRLSTSEVQVTEKRALKKLRSPVALATYKLLSFVDIAGLDIATVTLI